ncbi:MAG: ATP-binding cassette domain-containing protein [Elusimicrobiota bacterium]|nr:ATP-binding cassette domain-containing protein [Elusimicrobiota bacterium]MDH5661567.1 ATP-binding cassette domain-containing protein [Elusimicrobiota bacterium]
MKKEKLEVKNIKKTFGTIYALNNVDMEAEKGLITGLLGDNGAGKSTLIKILRGVYRPDSGEIYINEEKKVFKSPRDAIREGIQCVYQDSTLIEELNVSENFFMAEEIIKSYLGGLVPFVDFERERKTAAEFLSKMGFYYDVNRQVKYLSGGERRALAVMRAFYFQPKILLLDEPVIALSEVAREKMFKILKDIKKTCATILVTHEVDLALDMCDKLVILKTGKVTFKGDASKISRKGCLKCY